MEQNSASDEFDGHRETLRQAQEIKDKLGLDSIDTALHLLAIEAVDSLRADFSDDSIEEDSEISLE